MMPKRNDQKIILNSFIQQSYKNIHAKIQFMTKKIQLMSIYINKPQS